MTTAVRNDEFLARLDGIAQSSSGITCIMPKDDILTLRQADQARTDFALIEDQLEFIMGQLARVPTRAYLCRTLLCGLQPVASGQPKTMSV
jgi:hypothetical protein